MYRINGGQTWILRLWLTKKFGGDEEKALRALGIEAFHSCSFITGLNVKERIAINRTLTKRQTQILMDAFYDEAEKFPKLTRVIIDAVEGLSAINMTNEQVLNAKGNPFKKRIIIIALILVVYVIVSFRVTTLARIGVIDIPAMAMIIISVVNKIAYAVGGVLLARNIRKYSKFDEVKNDVIRFNDMRKRAQEEKIEQQGKKEDSAE